MLPFLILLQLDTGRLQATQDSITVYNAYKDQIAFLKGCIDYQKWYDCEAKADSSTACAKLRLKKYNGEDYLPEREFNKEGMGTAVYFPNPQEQKVFERKRQPQELEEVAYFDKRTGKRIK